MTKDDTGTEDERRRMEFLPEEVPSNRPSECFATRPDSPLIHSSETIDRNKTIGIAQKRTSAWVSDQPRRAAWTASRDGFMSEFLFFRAMAAAGAKSSAPASTNQPDRDWGESHHCVFAISSSCTRRAKPSAGTRKPAKNDQKSLPEKDLRRIGFFPARTGRHSCLGRIAPGMTRVGWPGGANRTTANLFTASARPRLARQGGGGWLRKR